MSQVRITVIASIYILWVGTCITLPLLSAQSRDTLHEQTTISLGNEILCPTLQISSAKELIPAVLGELYNKQIQVRGGQAPLKFELTKGVLPSGLFLTPTGQITGTPGETGLFNFSVRISDSCPHKRQMQKKSFKLLVKAPMPQPDGQGLAITVSSTPAHIDVTRGQSSTHTIVYTFADPSGASQLLKSTRGEFVAGSQVIETVTTTIYVSIRNGSGTTKETITISADLIEQALQLGFTSFYYCRNFYTTSNTLATTSRVDISINSGDDMTVTTTPDTVTVPDDRDAEVTILYSFSGSTFINTTLTSVNGIFYIGAEVLHTNATTLTASIYSGSGSVQETLSIPLTLLQAVLQRGLNQCEYKRIFSSPAGEISLETLVTIIISNTGTFSLSVDPSRLDIVRDQESLIDLTFTIRCTHDASGEFTSSEGRIMVGDTLLQQVLLPLTLSVRNCFGATGETLKLSEDLVRRVLEQNHNSFEYFREFRSEVSETVLTARTIFFITTGLAADLSIRSIDLRFDNNRPEVTVLRNHTPLTAQALLSYSGSGLIEGSWSVDGRPLTIFTLHLPPTGSATFELPQIQPLPTSDPGTHQVTFEIFSPPTGLPVPTIIYFVTSLDAPLPRGTLEITGPEMNAILPHESRLFSWKTEQNAALYQVDFFLEGMQSAFFSAYTRDASYLLPESLIREKFTDGKDYLWTVTSYNKNNDIISSSMTFRFSFARAITEPKQESEPESVVH